MFKEKATFKIEVQFNPTKEKNYDETPGHIFLGDYVLHSSINEEEPILKTILSRKMGRSLPKPGVYTMTSAVHRADRSVSTELT